jgi:flagellar basal-body rod modification protein FlgD
MTTTVPPTSGSSSSDSAASTAAAASAATSQLTSLNINDFLTLMTTQLQNQDPTNPVDSNTFVTQMAEFGEVSGIQSMQTSLASLSSTLQSSQALSGAALIGQSVLTDASSAQYTSGQSISGAISLPSAASSAVVDVTDSTGAVVAQIPVGTAAGLNNFTWDGTTLNGTPAPSGTYTFQPVANVGGSNTAPQTLLAGTVTSVTVGSNGSGMTLNTPQLGAVALSAVQQIN